MHVSGRAREATGPYFFLSYAHTPVSDGSRGGDPDRLVDRLYEDLCDHVMQLTDIPRGAAGFMDRRMNPGEGWSGSLSDALSRCRVFVPLYSPRYFRSVQCGKEWYTFSQRASYHRDSNGSRGEGVVPVLWVPVPAETMPGPAERLQFNHADFGTEYANEGLYGLSRLSYLRAEYDRVVYRLAQRIVGMGRDTVIAPGRHTDYREVPSAFGNGGGPRHLRVVVLACSHGDGRADRCGECYGSTALDWNPYHPQSVRSLVAHTRDLAGNLDYRVKVGAFEDEIERILASDAPASPEVLLVDRWTLADERYRDALKRFDTRYRPWISVMLPWNREHPGASEYEEELRTATEAVLGRKLQEGPADYRLTRSALGTLDAFYDDLPTAVARATRQYLRHAPAYPPEGERKPRPRLVGPVAPGLSEIRRPGRHPNNLLDHNDTDGVDDRDD